MLSVCVCCLCVCGVLYLVHLQKQCTYIPLSLDTNTILSHVHRQPWLFIPESAMLAAQFTNNYITDSLPYTSPQPRHIICCPVGKDKQGVLLS